MGKNVNNLQNLAKENLKKVFTRITEGTSDSGRVNITNGSQGLVSIPNQSCAKALVQFLDKEIATKKQESPIISGFDFTLSVEALNKGGFKVIMCYYKP